MLPLLSLGLIFAVVVAVVTVRAFLTAPEGYEDELGFHLVQPWMREGDRRENAAPRAQADSSDVPPLAAVR